MKSIITIIIILFFIMATFRPLQADEGKELFNLRCGGFCHQLPEPSMLTAKQWRMIMTVMQQRMKQKGIDQLTDEEFETIFIYLKDNARH